MKEDLALCAMNIGFFSEIGIVLDQVASRSWSSIFWGLGEDGSGIGKG